MAFTPFLVLQTMSGGSDQTAPGPNGGNGGGFDPGFYTGMATDGTAVSGNTALPVFSSPSYAFKANDVGAWLYIANGATWLPGWYNILSVATSAATVNASPSGATLSGGNILTTTGFSTVASPTGAIWSVDYSQQPLSQFVFTDLTITSSSSGAATSALTPFGINHVGNLICISAGTGFTLQRAAIASISAGSIAIFDRQVGNVNASGGKGALGGAYASPGATSLIYVPGVRHFIKRANYVISSVVQAPNGRVLTGAGTIGQPVSIRGYDLVPGDETALINRPKIIGGAAVGSSLISMQNAAIVENLILDGRMQNFTSNRGIAVASTECRVRRCLFKNFDNNAIQNTGSTSDFFLMDCEITSCSGQAAFTTTGTSQNTFFDCYIHDNTIDGVTFTTAAPSRFTAYFCIFANNKFNATKSHVVFNLDTHAKFVNCAFYNAGSHAIDVQALSQVNVYNCIFENNGGWAININTTGLAPGITLYNNGWYNNTLGNYDTNKVYNTQVYGDIVNTVGTFFNNARDGNYSLNKTLNQGKMARAAAFPINIVNTPTLQFLDVGAAQHLDSDGNNGYSIGGVF